MPLLHTSNFGDIEYAASAVFHFPSGLPGFETERQFVFIEQPNTDPLMFMHSLSRADLCFIVLPILVADPHYRLSLAPEDRAELRLPGDLEPRIGEDILCGALVCAASGEGGGPTANLLAPIVVNLKEGIGMQVIQTESGYSHQHPLFAQEELAPCS